MKNEPVVKGIAQTGMLAALIIFFAVPSYAQDTAHARMESHAMEALKDSTTINMMMDHIASDPELRTKMMDKLMLYCKKDSTSMMEMCKKMMDNKDMRGMMMKMMSTPSEKDHGMDNMMMGEDSTKSSMKDTTSSSGHAEHHKKK